MDGALDSGLGVDVIYLDYSKAFDSVPHLRLIGKLQAYGIRGNLLKWIENFLIGRQQKIILNGSSSKWCTRVLPLSMLGVSKSYEISCHLADNRENYVSRMACISTF